MSKEIKEENVRVNAKIPVKVGIKGKTPDGTKCKVVFHREATPEREVIETLEKEIKQSEISFDWTAKGKKDGGLKDDEVSALVHCEIQIDGQKPGSASDYLQFRVWASEFTVKILNSEDGDKLYENSNFRVKYPSGHKTLRFSPNNAKKDGMELALSEFSTPELSIVHPYEIVGQWTLKTGRVYEAKAKKKPFKAVFLDTPGASTEEGKYKRAQYVNIEGSTKYDEGHLIKVKIGADVTLTADADAFVEVAFSGAAGGKRSERSTPKPELLNADSNDKDTTYKKKIKLQGKAGGSIELELGLAGGDVCTIKIGASDKCEDGSLEITNWRRIGFHLFLPANEMTSFGKLGDTDDGSLSEKDLKDIQKELDKAFIEYSCVAVHKFNEQTFDELKHHVVDAKFLKRTGGSKAFWADSDMVERILPKLKALIPGKDKQPYYHSAIVVDRLLEREKSAGAVTVKMTSASQEVKLHSSDFYCFKYRSGVAGAATGVRYIKAVLTKLDGKEVDSTDPLAKPRFLLQPSWDFKKQDDAIEKYIEHIDATKIKLKFPPGTDVGDIIKDHKNVEFTVSIEYSKFKDAEAVGMCIGSELLAYPSMGCFSTSQGLYTTIIHEVMHMLDFAYMDPVDKDGKKRTHGSKHPIPGLKYRAYVPEGFVYEGHGHAGGHCATGLSADQRKKEDFSSLLLNFAPTCLCWGQDVWKFSSLVLCDECALYARAQDLRDLSKLA